MSIQQDMALVLRELANQPGEDLYENQALADKLELSPERLNDAVRILDDSGYVKPLRVMGTGNKKTTMEAVIPPVCSA